MAKSRNLVPVGTHVPLTTKITLQALAESQNKTVYEILQEVIMELTEQYDKELDALKKEKAPTQDSSDLL